MRCCYGLLTPAAMLGLLIVPPVLPAEGIILPILKCDVVHHRYCAHLGACLLLQPVAVLPVAAHISCHADAALEDYWMSNHHMAFLSFCLLIRQNRLDFAS
jgi:hypothetical protein